MKRDRSHTGPPAIAWVGVLLVSAGARADTFELRVLDARSAHNSCAVMDVDGDGDLDVVAGGWWYEAPSWKKHFVRDVQVIRGRFDDYSSLPMDVDGDGRLDLISANYRSKSIYWVRNPGNMPGAWPTFVIDSPGPMETGRLADVDGDGQIDLLPNGVQFAAWWELDRPATPTDPQRVRWIRHDLPDALAGHGIGIGDIDGDGRDDLVGTSGWFQAPADRRRERWVHHREFRLPRDGSIPILVTDVDHDGDADLIWGRAHDIGLYWLEQTTESGGRDWKRHAIDTSWSQPHSLLLADMNGDGSTDLIAGKRYMGHDGKDPGEYDPLVCYWYEFSKGSRTWRRHSISSGGPAGFGLDPKAVDLDQDGDTDVVVADRSGLYWFEHRSDSDAAESSSESGDRPSWKSYANHRELMSFAGDDGQLAPVRSPADWATRRAHVLSGMRAAMGELPEPARRVPLDIVIVSEEPTDHYVRRRIIYHSEAGNRVPAHVLIPDQLNGQAPAMLCLHSTIDIGKDQVVGLGGRESRQYADQLARRGYVCIAPDYPSFGQYDYDFERAAGEGRHASGTMQAVWDNLRAIDVLQSMPEVDENKIGCIGHSLGGHNGLFTAALDQRLRVVVTSCGFTGFHHYYGGDLTGWTSARYIPRIANRFGKDPDRVPFDFHEVLAALAPRPVFVSAPLHDSNFDVVGVREVTSAARDVYRLLGAESNLTVVHPDCEHDFPDDVRESVYQWLDRHLSGN